MTVDAGAPQWQDMVVVTPSSINYWIVWHPPGWYRHPVHVPHPGHPSNQPCVAGKRCNHSFLPSGTCPVAGNHSFLPSMPWGLDRWDSPTLSLQQVMWQVDLTGLVLHISSRIALPCWMRRCDQVLSIT